MSEKVTSEVIGYVNPQTGEVLPVNAVPLPPDESRPTNLKPKRKPDHSKKEIDLGFGIFTMNKVEYTDSERTTLRIFYEDNGEKEFTLLENDPSRKWLVDQVYVLTSKDEIMENTYQRIVAEEASFKEFAIHQGKEQGYLIDPVAYYDSESNSAKVDTKFYTQSIKLFFNDFNSEKQKEDLFVCKLAAFELDIVKKCNDKELKSKIRKADNPLEVIETLIQIKKNSAT